MLEELHRDTKYYYLDLFISKIRKMIQEGYSKNEILEHFELLHYKSKQKGAKDEDILKQSYDIYLCWKAAEILENNALDISKWKNK